MGEQGANQEKAAVGLPRLPPGRHGLGREFVVKNQRDRLTVGIIAVVSELGYHDATVSQICAAAGVSRRTFYSHFASKEACYLEAFDLIGQYLSETVTEASTEESDWPGRVRARIRAMLEVFTANPDLVRFTLIVPLRSGEAIAARHRRALEGFLNSLTADRPSEKQIREPSPAVEQALVGGLFAVVSRKVETGEEDRLLDLLPDLVELFLVPYVGGDEARRAAHSGA